MIQNALNDRNRVPFTIALMVMVGLGVGASLLHLPLVSLFMFSTEGAWWLRPWTLVTWPFVSVIDSLNALTLPIFACIMAWNFLGSLERSWGTRKTVVFFFGCAALMALGVGIGATLLHHNILLMGCHSALVAPLVSFCVLNRHAMFNFFGIAIPPFWIAGFFTAFLWYTVGFPFIGLFAMVAPAFAYWYASGGQFTLFTLGKWGAMSRRKPSLVLRDYTQKQTDILVDKKVRREQNKSFEDMMRRSYSKKDASEEDEK
jgi:hypothetical protein